MAASYPYIAAAPGRVVQPGRDCRWQEHGGPAQVASETWWIERSSLCATRRDLRLQLGGRRSSENGRNGPTVRAAAAFAPVSPNVADGFFSVDHLPPADRPFWGQKSDGKPEITDRPHLGGLRHAGGFGQAERPRFSGPRVPRVCQGTTGSPVQDRALNGAKGYPQPSLACGSVQAG